MGGAWRQGFDERLLIALAWGHANASHSKRGDWRQYAGLNIQDSLSTIL